MRETVKSLKIYLLLAGIVSTMVQLAAITSSGVDMIGKVLAGIGMVVSIAYIFGGANATEYIAHKPQRLIAILLVGGAYSIIMMLLIFLFSGGQAMSDPVARKAIIQLGIALAVTAYLLVNVQRLAKESQAQQTEE